MGKVICRVCGCPQLVSQNNMYVCSECGTIHTPQEVQAMANSGEKIKVKAKAVKAVAAQTNSATVINQNTYYQQDFSQQAVKTGKKPKKKSKAKAVVITLLAVCLAAGVGYAASPFGRYQIGKGLISAGKYKEAKAVFRNLGNFRDSDIYERAIVCRPEKTKYYDSESVTTSKNRYRIGDDGRLLKSTYISGTYTNEYSYKYDDDGNCIKSIGEYRFEKLDYDKDGRLESRKIGWNPDDESEIAYRFDYEYDKKGNCTSETVTYEEGDWSSCEYEYDKKGNCIKYTFEDNGGTCNTTEYGYDKHGNLTDEVTTSDNPDASIFSADYEYDKKDRIVSLRYVYDYQNGEKTVTEAEFEYDDKGNCIRVSGTTDGREGWTEYKYDDDGNCIESVTSEGIKTEYSGYVYYIDMFSAVTDHEVRKVNLDILNY